MDKARQYRTIVKLGNIEIPNGKSGKIAVGDPCYHLEDMSVLELKPGVYETAACYADCGDWGTRIAWISITDTRYTEADERLLRYKDEHSIGVDSGQAGIFDLDYFLSMENEHGEYDDPNTFYGKCCQITIPDCSGTRKPFTDQVGLLKDKDAVQGVVSSSGFGDGCYPLYVARKYGKAVSVCLLFLDSEDILECHEKR